MEPTFNFIHIYEFFFLPYIFKINFLSCVFKDSEDDQKQDCFGSRISSDDFLIIMEDGIRTFMNFLKADKEKPCQIISAFFKRKRRGSVDPTLLHLMKKVNQKVSLH
jgi:hypothetical protein